ncbi:phage tail protein [Pectobacterium cacticida]|uniref:phage tail protein n=1 Tax=Pectobacterium cacticida TaxID=69221 RepID=UPI003986B0E2
MVGELSVLGVEELKNQLNSLSRTAVPRASAQAVNRVASRALSRSTARVSRSTRVPRRLVRGRARLVKASTGKPVATIRVWRNDLPAIALGTASMRISRKTNGKAGSVLKIGRFTFPGAFIQQLANGRWHVLRRTSKSRYPIEVVKIAMAIPLTTAYREEVNNAMDTDMPKELSAALSNQMRILFSR